MDKTESKRRRKLNEDKILRAYQFFKSKRKVADILKIPIYRVEKVLHERKAMKPWSGFQGIKPWRGGNRGPVTRWIQDHPGVVLPLKPSEISKLTGCSIRDVHSWKTARTAKFKRLVKYLVPEEAIETVRSRIQTVEIKGGRKLNLEDLEKMVKVISDRSG